MTADRCPRGGLSHVIGDTTPPLLELTIPQLLDRAVAAHGAREAMVFCAEGIRWSYAQFAAEVDRLAGGLHRLGIVRGDRVGIWAPNRSEWVLTQFATARLGVILVCINPAYRLFELEFALNKVGCVALVTARAFKTSDYVGMLQRRSPRNWRLRAGRACGGAGAASARGDRAGRGGARRDAWLRRGPCDGRRRWPGPSLTP